MQFIFTTTILDLSTKPKQMLVFHPQTFVWIFSPPHGAQIFSRVVGFCAARTLSCSAEHDLRTVPTLSKTTRLIFFWLRLPSTKSFLRHEVSSHCLVDFQLLHVGCDRPSLNSTVTFLSGDNLLQRILGHILKFSSPCFREERSTTWSDTPSNGSHFTSRDSTPRFLRH